MHDLKNAAEPGAGEAQAFADAKAGEARDKIANTLMGPLASFRDWSSRGPMPGYQDEGRAGQRSFEDRRGGMLAKKEMGNREVTKRRESVGLWKGNSMSNRRRMG